MRVNIETGVSYKHRKQVQGAVEFYWVKTHVIDDWDFEVLRQFNNSVYDWCVSTYGRHLDWSFPDRRWGASDNSYYFKHEKDRTAFLLRWG